MKPIKYLLFVAFAWARILCAQTPEELRSWLPEIQGWAISEKIEAFSPENLYDRINGSAPLFLENNFREMTSMEYTRGGDYITIQAYRHATPEDAFGMYASERSPDFSYFPIGVEAQGDSTNIYFCAGSMYVKIWGEAEGIGSVLQEIAQELAIKIAPEAKYPIAFTAFPGEGKIPFSKAYITSNYIGHEFLRSVYTEDYEIEGQAFQAFVIDAKTGEGALEVLRKYLAFTKQGGDLPEDGKLLIIKDRYNGDIPVIKEKQFIAGIFSESGAVPGAEELLRNLAVALSDL